MSESLAYLDLLAARGYRGEDAPRFLAAWAELEARYLERIAALTGGPGGWRERFRAAAAETVRLIEAFPREARFLTVDALAAGDLGRGCQRALADRAARFLDQAREELDDPASVPENTASWIVAIFFDRIYRRCATGAGRDLRAQLPELMFLAISAYFGAEDGLRELVPPA